MSGLKNTLSVTCPVSNKSNQMLTGNGHITTHLIRTAIRNVQHFLFEQAPFAQSVSGDEYEIWCSDTTEHGHTDDPMEYWFQRRFRYLRLFQMAMDFLSVQSMSAECERLFSSMGKMISADRSCFDAVMVGVCQCLRS